MEFLHLTRFICPDFLTDDFGTHVQVIPGDHCRFDFAQAEQRVVDEKSWIRLFDVIEA